MNWPTNHDDQVAIILLAVAAIGAIFWLVRSIRRAGQAIDNAPEFERSPFVKVGPGVYAIRPDSDLAAELREAIVGLECELTAEEVEAWMQSREGTA